MTAADVYLQELYRLGWGTPLWEPDYIDINPGDVGFIQDHHFVRLFNATLSEFHGDQVLGVPLGFEPMEVPSQLRQPPRWYFEPRAMRSSSVEQHDLSIELTA